MSPDRESIERKEFNRVRGQGESVATAVSAQVRGIIEAAENSANQIRSDAERDAREIRREAQSEAKPDDWWRNDFQGGDGHEDHRQQHRRHPSRF